MFKKRLRGDGNIFVILILAAVIGFSFLAADGILPRIKPDDKFEKLVSEVFLPASEKSNSLQLKNLEFNANSVTVIPSPTLAPENPGVISPTSSLNTPIPTQLASAPTLSPTRSPSSSISPTQTSSPGTSPTRGSATTPPTSTPRPIATPTPGLAPLNSFQKNLLALARSQIGEKYSMGACQDWSSSSNRPGNPPSKSNACSRWDCSNWLAWVYYWATNGKIVMKSQTCSDYGQCWAKYGGFTNYDPPAKIFTKYSYKDRDKLQFGDLVYFGSRSGSLPEISHVGLYIGEYGSCGGNDCIIDASASGGGVSERRLSKVPKTLVGFLRPKI